MLLVADPCPICGTGNVGFRRCDDGQTVVLTCDECDAVWLGPREIEGDTALFPSAPGFVVPGLKCSTGGQLSGWATRDEVSKAGWSSFIAGEGTALDGG